MDLRSALPRRILKRRSATGPQIRATFNLIDGKPEKRGSYFGINISLHRPPRAADQVTYEFHDETLKKGRWPTKAASASFESFILSNGDSLLAASIRIPGKDTLRVTSSLYKALRLGHGSNPKPEVASALREIRKSSKS